jgi:hypothetical protein
MRRVISSSLLAITLLVVAPVPSDAWRNGGGGQGTTWRGGGHGTWRGGGHGRAFIGVGPAFWWGAAYPWYYPPYYAYAYAPYAYAPPPVIVQEPPVYPQAAPAPDSPPQAYWYYCPSARSYYPAAPTCPEVWVKVPPRPE